MSESKTDQHRVGFEIPKELWRKVRLIAASENKTAAVIMADLLDSAVSEKFETLKDDDAARVFV